MTGQGRVQSVKCPVSLLIYGDPWECEKTYEGHDIHQSSLADITVTWTTAKSVGSPRRTNV